MYACVRVSMCACEFVCVHVSICARACVLECRAVLPFVLLATAVVPARASGSGDWELVSDWFRVKG